WRSRVWMMELPPSKYWQRRAWRAAPPRGPLRSSSPMDEPIPERSTLFPYTTLFRSGLETLVIIMVANKYAFLQITRRRFLNEWEAFKKVISRRNIRRRITIPLTLSNLKLLRRITRTENILHRNFTRR